MSKKCKVVNGRIEPCNGLNEVYEYYGKGKGLQLMHLTNIETGEHSRSMLLIKSGKWKDRGLVANVCPICGTDISSHLKDWTEKAA